MSNRIVGLILSAILIVGGIITIYEIHKPRPQTPVQKATEGKPEKEQKKIAISYENMPEGMAKQAQKWANGSLPPSTYVVIKDGKIEVVYMAADPWHSGVMRLESRTAMHLVAQNFQGKDATEKNLQQLSVEMEWAIQYHFSVR